MISSGLLLLAACDDSGGSAGEATATVTTTVTTTVDASPTASPTVHLEEFQLPSGNIKCALEQDQVCVISEADFDPMARPADCDFDWNDQMFWMDPGGGTRGGCVSDTAFTMAEPPVLPYGAASVVNGVRCESTQTGVTCTDESGHGFRVSRASYDLY